MKLRYCLLRGITLPACAAAALFATAALAQAQDPSVIITNPDQGESIDSSSVNVFLVAKANIGELTHVNVRMDDQAIVQATPMAFSNNGWFGYSVLFEDLVEGDHTVKAFPVDTNGNFGFDRIDFEVATEIITDTEAPTIPTNLRVVSKTDNSIGLAWDASFDNVAVTRYKISSRDLPDQYHVDNATSYVISNLAAETTYRFKIKAYDAANNFSVYGPETTATTESESGDYLIAYPANEASLGAGDIPISVNAPLGTESVTFSINGYEVATATSAPFGYTYNNLQGGSYTLSAVANHDGMTTSDSITITVDPTFKPGQFNFIRIHNEAIISRHSFFDVGANRPLKDNGSEFEWDNINGPCVIRVPDWIAPENRAHTNAQYYCYFGHHHGRAIRLAWAENIAGPWKLYNMDADVDFDKRGVLSFDNGGSYEDAAQRIDLESGVSILGHMASPDIFVDHENEQIVMFFHGKYEFEGDDPLGQVTFTASSPYGLSFRENIGNAIDAKSYFATFWYNGELYGFDSSGTAYHHPDPHNNLLEPGGGFDYSTFYWEQNDVKTIQHKENPYVYVRHIKPLVIGDTLFAAYSGTRDTPEQLYYVTVDLTEPNWRNWEQQPTFNSPDLFELATAEAGWEGGHFPPLESAGSAMDEGVNQLRDPQFFRDIDGEFYMFYVGQGEDAIGVARLQWED